MTDILLLAGEAETALGGGAALQEALNDGRSGASRIRRFDPTGLVTPMAACVGIPEAERRAGENLTQALLRRILSPLRELPPVQTIIWAGVKGNAEYVESGRAAGAVFPFLPRHYSRWIRDVLGWPDADLREASAACASSTVGLAAGARMVADGRSRSVLVVAADIVSRFSSVGFSALNALSPGVCRPFDDARDGLILGDGAAACLLAGRAYAREAGRGPMARLTGWAVTNDANHITAPARDGRGLSAAIRAALDLAGRNPDEVGAFCAHGTGTVYNDAMELTSIETVFGNRRFPVFSIKGALGHTLGAAGGIETIVCARALESGSVPPTAGLRTPEPRAAGRVTGGKQSLGSGVILNANSGFGGVNAVVVLERTDGGEA
ncbi:MAG: beta-ketoacyl synthase N-terminal-like domain-containing protein [Acidobacteriota bacterium]|nr:beta-ketoacyl synthase N-terminal-like domain-containing protein [Acidobacteriota bacterium]